MGIRDEFRKSLKGLSGFVGEADGSYSVGKFYTKASDERGHNKSLRFDIPPQLAGMINEVLNSGLLPYRSTADLIRDAIHHRLRFLTSPENAHLLLAALIDDMQDREMAESVAKVKAANYAYLTMRQEIGAVMHQCETLGVPVEWAQERLMEWRGQAQEKSSPYREMLTTFIDKTLAKGVE